MNITISRLRTNHLYTEGRLLINDLKVTHTIESSEVMLPTGRYLLRLVNRSARKRELVIFERDGSPTGWRIGIGHSWIGSRKDRIISIGQIFFPGATYKSTPDYERIIKRLEKCQERKEQIDLTIEENRCLSVCPINHWITPLNQQSINFIPQLTTRTSCVNINQ